MGSEAVFDRRPIEARHTRWAAGLASGFADRGVSPNAISVASAVAALCGGALILRGGVAAYMAAAGCAQLRLLCNLLDGMVALEHGRATTAGPLFNELPDRVADTALLLALGYAAGAPALGWAAALLAMGTSVVRLLGGALGQPQDFCGPMAKPHRMAVLTLALLAAAISPMPAPCQQAGAGLIAAGSLVTCITRTWRLARRLRAA